MDNLQTTTLERPVEIGCGNRCRDYDEDCIGIEDKFSCWKYDPIQGICPFLSGEKNDPTF